MFRRLDNRFGNKAKIVLRISEEVQNLPPVKGNNPRKASELMQAVERALSNLVILGEEDVINSRWVAQSLESKLPSSPKEKWIAHKTEPVNGFAHVPSVLMKHMLAGCLLAKNSGRWTSREKGPI